MQRIWTALLLLLSAVPAFAQAAIPGTFATTRPLPNPDLYSIPLIETPQISFGSALTPPVIVTGQTMFVSSPHAEYEPSLLSNQATMTSQPTFTGRHLLTQAPVAPFDFVVAPTESMPLGQGESEGTSLGEVAASLRKGPPPTQHTYTNADIDRLNQSNGKVVLPNGKAPEQLQQPPANQNPQQNPNPQENQNPSQHQTNDRQSSPFSPQLLAEK